MGYNGFPRGVLDTVERYADRKMKYALVVHAESNALANAANIPRGATIYCTLHPCEECSKLIVQAGISRVVIPNGSAETRRKQLEERGDADRVLNMELADLILREGGVEVCPVITELPVCWDPILT
jgi:deoxycytidylate deaminase